VTVMLLLLLLTAGGGTRGTMPVAMAQQQQTQIAEGQCGSEADELANCAAQFGDIDVGACLSCVSGALVKSAALANTTTCAAYNATFCSSIQSECQASCDDDRCGAEFSLYYLCEAAAAYKNVTSESAEQQGLCDIDCGSIGNSSDAGGTTNNGTATTNDDTGSGGNVPGSCNATWNDLRSCLIAQGRDDPAQEECDSCIQGAIPISSSTSSVDCSALNEQYCNAVTSCESVCAQAACASEFDVQLRCAAELAATAAGSTCQITKCGSDATSAAASPLIHGPGWFALNRNRAKATLAVVVVAAVAL
jgi:hypothetical protein